MLSVSILGNACRSPQASGIRRKAGDAGVYAVDAGPTSCDQLSCADPATCMVQDGKASCVCPSGYQTDPDNRYGCQDIDECATASANDCDANATCTNTPGGFSCTCAMGYLGNGKLCMKQDDCGGAANTCHADAICTKSGDGISCMCSVGFEDVSGDGHICRDIDECEQGTAMCADNAHCQNTRGSYQCLCNPLYQGDGNVACRSLCQIALGDASRCDPNMHARCTYTPDGTAQCTSCYPGYVGDGKTCQMNSECDALHCGENTVCTGDPGSRRCECAPGYEGDPHAGCTDIDECSSGAATCDATTSICSNQPGGYVCNCQPGFERVNGSCVNIDECARNLDLCDPGATCTDQTPGYTCQCKPGYRGDDGFTCVDIDECAEGTDNCAKDGTATCQNTRGSYQCICPKGYAGGSNGEACYCDLSGYWGMRQHVTVTVPEKSAGNVVLISQSVTHAVTWELDRYTYDGKTIHVQAQPCGTNTNAELYSPLYMETYSSFIPNSVYDGLGLMPGSDISLASADALPGKPYVTPSTAAVQGIKLDDPLHSPWPATTADVPDSAWVDSDNDGEPGITLWPGQTTQMTHDGQGTYSYLPVELEANSTRIATRVGCVSTALRSINHLEGHIDTCGHMSGTVINEKAEGRVHSCTVLRMSDWDTLDVTCSAQDWSDARHCSTDQINFLDGQDQTSQTTADFELVKLGDLNSSNIDCAAVRMALPADTSP